MKSGGFAFYLCPHSTSAIVVTVSSCCLPDGLQNYRQDQELDRLFLLA